MPALLALASAAFGLLAAAQHPLWPGLAVAVFLATGAGLAWRPAVAFLALPALLPVLNFSPWTGWLALDELDLLVLATAAGGHSALAWRRWRSGPESWPGLQPAVRWLLLALLAINALACARGVADAGGFDGSWWPGPQHPTRALMLFKPTLWVLLLWLPLSRFMQDHADLAWRRLGQGMCAGLALLSLGVLWERAATTGLDEFSRPYRTVGMFWEMHVGGATIDAYLALAMPWLGWALHRARRPARYAAVAILALIAAYACLTTFSRGVYAAVLLPLFSLGLALWWTGQGATVQAWRALVGASLAVAAGVMAASLAFVTWGLAGVAGAMALATVAWLAVHRVRPLAWRPWAGRGLAVVLVLEVLAVLTLGNFLSDRVRQVERDFGMRLAHWRHGLDTRHGAADLALGIGMGRLPPRLAAGAPGHAFSGNVDLLEPGDRPGVRLEGPRGQQDLAGLFSLTQRLPLQRGVDHFALRLEVRASRPSTLIATVCELHLLYERRCLGRWLSVPDTAGTWRTLEVDLDGPPLDPGPAWAPRQVVFMLSIGQADTEVAMANLRLATRTSSQLLRNPDFQSGLAHWMPLAQSHFLPWHIDNLYLEWWIERGPAGLVAFVALGVILFSSLLRGAAQAAPAERAARLAMAASMAGIGLVGTLSSVLDTGRPAFLATWMFAVAAVTAGSTRPANRRVPT